MDKESFKTKWSLIKEDWQKNKSYEHSLFVDVGSEPVTQRQLNAYNYFLFIKNILKKYGERCRVLEVGCGRGTLSLYLNRYLGLKVDLLDNEVDAIMLAKEEFRERGADAEFYVADALDSGLSADSYDVVISIGLAEHIVDVKKLFAEEYRILKKGGVMISLNIPKKFSIQYLNNLVRFIKKLSGAYRDIVARDYFRSNLQDCDYHKIAKEVGFKNIEVVHVCPFPLFTQISGAADKNITKIYKIILKVRGIFQKYVYKTNKIFGQAHFLVGYK